MPGQRFSHQRERIYQAVRDSGEHPTAEMVYQSLKPEMPRLSLGTVYRNLHQMAQEGRLTEIQGAVVRFDGCTAPHTHLRCLRCGGVFDLTEIPYDRTLDDLAARQGVRILGHALLFTGICSACADKEKIQETDQLL